MNIETKSCKNCSKDFEITAEDFDFYKKIDVPSPTWCPDCRQRRRYAWRNERTLYRRDCDLCKKSTVTIYSPSRDLKVYCPPCWWGDGWDAGEYARDFDFSRPFFEQFHELQKDVPRLALLTKNSVNSDYTNHSAENKDCYLCFGNFEGENDMYCTNMYGGKTKDCLDCYHTYKGGELLYECIDTEQCYRCQNCYYMRSCSDCYYCFDCRGSQNCFLSSNLRNKQYVFLNEQLTKEEYEKKVADFNLSSHEIRQKLYNEWLEVIEKNAIHKFAVIEQSTAVLGNRITNSKNAISIFDGDEMEDVKYTTLNIETKNSMDCYHVGISCDLLYEGQGIVRCARSSFIHLCYDNNDIQYCDTCHNSKNLFGCIGVKKGEHMVFNRKYSREEYEDLRSRIIEHMKKGGEYGEFFPPEIAPVSYNETQGMIYMPLSKVEALKRGWQWEENMPGTFGKETMQPEDIPDDIKDVKDSITREVLKCVSCTKNYNIVAPELSLLKREGIPAPRLCPDCRYKRRIKLRGPRKLWHRQCMCELEHETHEGRCPNEFETAYEDGRKEKVYCETCYSAEVV